jgi:hypothetical protein
MVHRMSEVGDLEHHAEAVPAVLRQNDRLPLVTEPGNVGAHDERGDPDDRAAVAVPDGG